ncbi:hypothetical protein [Alkalihalobacillus sp. BA299]|uniref:hypothetical protein n=1 Tax=Alkalihalobacillus sp. BA299 TaxID=2815938 RepID=UPI001ADC8A91|nr:hypothetical protein [Alkalihalobacillus sp. BA299]
MKIDPLNPIYLKGFNDGYEAGKKVAVDYFADGFEKLQNTKGVGEKTIRKMIKAMDLPVDEVKE